MSWKKKLQKNLTVFWESLWFHVGQHSKLPWLHAARGPWFGQMWHKHFRVIGCPCWSKDSDRYMMRWPWGRWVNLTGGHSRVESSLDWRFWTVRFMNTLLYSSFATPVTHCMWGAMILVGRMMLDEWPDLFPSSLNPAGSPDPQGLTLPEGKSHLPIGKMHSEIQKWMLCSLLPSLGVVQVLTSWGLDHTPPFIKILSLDPDHNYTDYCFLIVLPAFVFSPQSSGMEGSLRTDFLSLSTFCHNWAPWTPNWRINFHKLYSCFLKAHDKYNWIFVLRNILNEGHILTVVHWCPHLLGKKYLFWSSTLPPCFGPYSL